MTRKIFMTYKQSAAENITSIYMYQRLPQKFLHSILKIKYVFLFSPYLPQIRNKDKSSQSKELKIAHEVHKTSATAKRKDWNQLREKELLSYPEED